MQNKLPKPLRLRPWGSQP